MGKQFEVGKKYECANFHMHPITVLSRTKKNVTVNDGFDVWGARVKIDNDGDEYIQRSTIPLRYYGLQTYSASWELKSDICHIDRTKE